MPRKSTWKAVGTVDASRTNYVMRGTISPTLAALVAMDFVSAWQTGVEDLVPTAKGAPRPRPKTVTITIHLS